MIYAIIIADDLTGAMDSAVHFAVRGFSTQVLTELPEEKSSREAEKGSAAPGDRWLQTDAQVVAVNANSRHLPADEAYRIVYDLAEKAGRAGVRCIYKKTDSALRGNVGAELSAMRRALGLETLPFIPAYPRLGRIVVEGRLLIDGIPAAKTALGSDPIDPLTSSQVRTILENTAPEGEAACIRVFDAASQEDLVRTAAILGDQLSVCAGCGGFAEVLAENFAVRFAVHELGDRKNSKDPESPENREGGMLLICGSLHENSLTQVEEAKRQGHPVFMIPEQILSGENRNEEGHEFAKKISEELIRRNLCILTTADPAKPSPDTRKRELVQAGVGQIVREICDTGCVRSLCIFGGDTLLAVMRILQVDLMWIRREVQPGVVLGSIEYRGKMMPVITKAGSFGDADLIGKLPGVGA